MKKIKALDPKLWDDIYKEIPSSHPVLNNIVQFIVDEIEPPYSISINGGWGSGKTTFLMILEEKLNQKDFKTIWFNPWEYERMDDIVLAFLQKITLKFKRDFKLTEKELGIFALSLFASGIDIAAKFFTQGKLSVESVKKIFEDVDDAFKKKYESFEDIIEIIKNDFLNITKLLYERNNKKPLIVFFDDLDRCLPDKALNLLEALKNLFVVKDSKVIFISAMDSIIIKDFINSRYKDIEKSFAANYFKKIFNLTINVPSFNIEKLDNVLSRFLSKIFVDTVVEQRTESFKNLIIKFINNAEINNYRSIFNIINNYYFIIKIMEESIDDSRILPLLVLREKWPVFFEEIIIETRKGKGFSFGVISSIKKFKEMYEKDVVLKKFVTQDCPQDDIQNLLQETIQMCSVV